MQRFPSKDYRQRILNSGLALLMVIYISPGQANDLLAVYHQAAQEDPQLEKAREALGAVQETQTQASAALFLPEATPSANVNNDRQNIQFSAGLRPVLATAENVQFANAQQDALARGLKETQQRQAVGFLAMTDVQEAQAGYDRAVSDAVEAEHLLSDAKESLQEVTGSHYEQLAALQDEMPLIPPDPADEARWVSQALAQNLGLRASEYAAKIAKSAIDVQKAGHLPTLDAIGSQSFATTGGRFGSADTDDTIAGLALNVPIYQGGRVNSRIRQAEHRYREAQATLKQEQRSVHRVASKAFLGVTTGISRVKALQQTLRSSETAVKATEAGFQAGYRTPLDVIVAERQRLSAQRDYARARYNYLLDTLRLKQAVGTLSPEDLAKVNEWLTAAPVTEN